ncbi:hypothetical protein [Siphonobacter sp. SORGH_AS_0500]|uniref:hypothetical protein n=1 Tax=Siphonobacter sp. SORGH_AS_0500 TaxID=1864824 RepID=UPI002860AB6B|nr:hypothetical protein [Siphonobacter sp. SORGH_AS_0500]MDR6194925.1 phosphate/sulfate permease [Siphonobacter sp. SORGH_AS_0500]
MGFFLGWIIGAFIAASVGSNRKIGFGTTLILSLILSPLVGILFAIASPSLATLEFQKKTLEALKQQNNSPSQRIDAELTRLIQLLNEGKITEAEYLSLRTKLMNQGLNPQPIQVPKVEEKPKYVQSAPTSQFDAFVSSWKFWLIVGGLLLTGLIAALITQSMNHSTQVIHTP